MYNLLPTLSPQDQYLQGILSKYKAVHPLLNPQLNLAQQQVVSHIKNWSGNQLSSIILSGSNAKGTALVTSADVDLFISLKPTTVENLRELYNKLDTRLKDLGYSTLRQNVSIGIYHNHYKFDLVPAKLQPGLTSNHSIYKRKQDSWQQTNIHKHISVVKNSGRINEILLAKRWREIHNFEFPSLYVELTAIDALTGFRIGDVANNFWRLLTYLSNKFISSRVIDPGNTNNAISDDLTLQEKLLISNQAKADLQKQHWEKIIW